MPKLTVKFQLEIDGTPLPYKGTYAVDLNEESIIEAVEAARDEPPSKPRRLEILIEAALLVQKLSVMQVVQRYLERNGHDAGG